MTPNWDIITQKIHGILKARGMQVKKMFDEDIKETFKIEDARQFYATVADPHDPNIKSYDILISLHDEDSHSHVDLQTPRMRNTQDFNDLFSLHMWLRKNINDKEGVSVNWFQFDKDIEAKKPPVEESRDISRPWGTTRSSFQRVGNCRMIVRHSDIVNEDTPGSRWRKIHKIFVETDQGERLGWPTRHVKGARAWARHLSQGGQAHDEVSSYLKTLSEHYGVLKSAARKLRQPAQLQNELLPTLAEIHQHMHDINNELQSWSGPRGYHSSHSNMREFRKTALAPWLQPVVEQHCPDHQEVLEQWLGMEKSIPKPELEEFQDWLSDTEVVIQEDQIGQAESQAQEAWQDYQLDLGSNEQAVSATLKFLVSSNDWWREQWEINPSETQDHLKKLVGMNTNPDVSRVKKLAGL
jgi:hypothetical protein